MMLFFTLIYVIPTVFMLCFNHYEIVYSSCRAYTNAEYLFGVLISFVPIINAVMMLSLLSMYVENWNLLSRFTNKITKWLDTPVKKGKLS
jgi:hypothetical protein